MVKYFWIKDFENSYRIIEKRKSLDKDDLVYSCIDTDVSTKFINEKNLLNEIYSPVMFNNISNMDNRNELFNSILKKMQFNNKTFEQVLIDIFVNGMTYDEISIKYQKCKPSISRIVKRFKSFYYCPDCKKVHNKKENNVLTEGYYWVDINNSLKIILLTKENNRFKIKGFGFKKGITYDIDFIKPKIVFKIEYPVDISDLNTEFGISRKIKRIESETRLYNTNTKKAVIDSILFKSRLTNCASVYKVNVSNISRLKKKVLSDTCCSCGNIIFKM
jgi:hypothetical protein